ncbi:MAG: hypothetical protein AAFQ87_11830 [Bacteroidota bacterium]
MLASTSHKPVIFLACVNSYRNGKRLRQFVNERKSISKLFRNSFLRKTPFQAVQKGNISNQYFFNLLQQNDYQNRVAIMHFSGPKGDNHLRVESDKFEVGMHIEELSKLIGRLPNLQAVFLSGCATRDLVEMLIRRDIPAVLVTQTDSDAEESHAIAQRFYHHLSKGKTVQEACQELQKDFFRFKTHRIQYDVEHDQLDWSKSLPGELPWGLYFLDDNAKKLEEPAILKRFALSLQQPTRKSRIKRSLQYAKFVAAALILGFLAVGIALYVSTPEQFVQLQQAIAL